MLGIWQTIHLKKWITIITLILKGSVEKKYSLEATFLYLKKLRTIKTNLR